MGDFAVLIGVRDPVGARSLVRVISASGLSGVVEVVGGMATVLVVFDPEGDDPDRHRTHLTHLMEQSARRSGDGGEGGEEVGAVGDMAEADAGRLFEIPSVFEGPDLGEVAAKAECTTAAVIELVTAATFTVDVVGFSPGFAYLAGLPPALSHIPRRPRPRPVVPAGSIALANGHAAVYPAQSPGGWHLIGHTDEPLFTPWVAPYARLAPGDRVRFTTTRESGGSRAPGWLGEPPRVIRPSDARPVFTVEEVGLRTVLQDSGRRGFAALGVPDASPADPYSFRLANQLVGNSLGAAVLEVTARGPTLRCLTPTFVAVVGGSPELWLQGQPVAAGRVVPVGEGQQLSVGLVRSGLRTYVAVAGGFRGDEVLGSCSSDQLSGLGPGPIGRGSQLWAGAMEPPLGDHLGEDILADATPETPTPLRVVPGPHREHFAPGTFESLASTRFMVDPDSNRVGLRLRRDPHTPPVLGASGTQVEEVELDSLGVVTGAVQVPPNGEPVILLTDHATLGGYPVVAVVAAVDHGRLGQCAPGSTVVLIPIDHDQAREALRRQRRLLDAAVVGRYPFAVD